MKFFLSILRSTNLISLIVLFVAIPFLKVEAKILDLGTTEDHILILGTLGINASQSGAQLQIAAPTGAEALRLISANNQSPFNIRNSADTADIFRIDQNGTLATGTIPWTRLSGFPEACSAGQFVTTISGSLICASPGVSSQWTTNDTSIYYNSGNVGIGTISPLSLFHLESSTTTNLLLNSTGINTVGSANLNIFRNNIGWGISLNSALDGSNDFMIRNIGGLLHNQPALTIQKLTNNIGIGLTNPTVALSVFGGASFSQPVSLATPLSNSDATTKEYVDGAIAAMAYQGVTYYGTTTISYNGNLGGYNGAAAKCALQFGQGARICTFQDAFAGVIPAVNVNTTTLAGWVIPEQFYSDQGGNAAVFKGLNTLNHNKAYQINCRGFASSSVNDYAHVYGYQAALTQVDCSTSHPIYCCR